MKQILNKKTKKLARKLQLLKEKKRQW